MTIYWRSYSEGVHSAPLKWLKPTQVRHGNVRVLAQISESRPFFVPCSRAEMKNRCAEVWDSIKSCEYIGFRRWRTQKTVSACTGRPGWPRWMEPCAMSCAQLAGQRFPPRFAHTQIIQRFAQPDSTEIAEAKCCQSFSVHHLVPLLLT
jgi:hypothetical protein